MSDSDDNGDGSDGAGLIVPLQQSTAKRIVAGQVISDLASTVKELVDNALDSGSKSVIIRLFNQGLDIIEVSDFGTGVPQDSRPLLAMKHATSKLRTFDELYADTEIMLQSQTLGFRGEALFSLANISKSLVVSTRTEDDAIGQKMEFRRDGYPDPNATADVARKVGTTVAVVKVFDALPVRRADLIKRVKIQRAKMLRLLQAYAVLCVGVRFNLSDVSGTVGSAKSKTEVKMNTSQNSKSIKETVSQVFGSKFLAGLCPLQVDLTRAISIGSKDAEDISNSETGANMWRIEGLVSKAPSAAPNGKSARDIQFFSINGRPVELPKVSQVVADAWRNFESVNADASKKRPACILRFSLPNSKFDINISPDKREVLLSEGAKIYDALRNALGDLWSGQSDGVFVANEVEDSCLEKNRPIIDVKRDKIAPSQGVESNENEPEVDASLAKRRKMKRRNAFVNVFGKSGQPNNTVFDHFREIEKIRLGVPADSSNRQHSVESEEAKYEETRLAEEEIDKHSSTHDFETEKETDQSVHTNNSLNDQRKWNQTKLQFSPARSGCQKQEIEALECMRENASPSKQDRTEVSVYNNQEPRVASKMKKRSKRSSSSSMEKLKKFAHPAIFATNASPSLAPSESEDDSSESEHDINKSGVDTNQVNGRRSPLHVTSKRRKLSNDECISPSSERSLSDRESIVFDDDKACTANRNREEENNTSKLPQCSVTWSGFSTASAINQFQNSKRIIKERRGHLAQLKLNREKNRESCEYEEENKTSNHKLSLSKDDFITMDVIGQFNLGFIMALGLDGHLWILDQHACDEKYNFEKMCKETKIHEQKLIAQLPLELSPSEENCVLENLDLFEKNGFRFAHDSSKPPRFRLALTAVPHSGSGGDGRKAVQFGYRDVGALCAMLGADGACSSNGYVAGSGTGADGGGKAGNNAVRRHAGTGTGTGNATIRLPKSIAMFASRACRSSIMIGDSLTRSKMETILRTMQNLDHPWECAHGRPTIRHVRDLLEDLNQDLDL